MNLIRIGLSSSKTEMRSRLLELLPPSRALGEVATLLLVTFGVAVYWFWTDHPNEINDPTFADNPVSLQSEVSERVMVKCKECGVIESIRVIERSDEGSGKTRNSKMSEISVRMSSGESHLFTDASLVHWRPGERLIVIEGTTP